MKKIKDTDTLRGSIKSLTLNELQEVLRQWQEPLFRAAQIFSWVYKKQVNDFDAMRNIPASLRSKLDVHFRLSDMKVKEFLTSSDGTKKLLLQLKEGQCIEAVSIPAQPRLTACVSTQAGCKFGCHFCASGLFRFARNLTVAEIIEQILYLQQCTQDHPVSHIVFMGMGEPLDNYDNLLKAIRILNAAYSLHIGARRMTISTCGIVPGIEKLAEEGLQVELSVSLHAADDPTRSRLMPINRTYPLPALMAACRKYYQKTNRQITFEYILIQDFNSDLQSAAKLSKIIEGLDCKINLIPCNQVEGMAFVPPNKIEFLKFRDYLLKHGVHVTVRQRRGEDIHSACGQLRLYDEKKK